MEYRDGLRTFVVIPNGWVHEGDGGAFSRSEEGPGRTDACQFYLQQPIPSPTLRN